VPKHVGAFDWTTQKSGHLMHLLVFYKDKLKHDRPAACVIAQQYSSATSYCAFAPARKNLARVLK
jgi:hypothetical protein